MFTYLFPFSDNHVQQLSTFCQFLSFAHIRELRLLLPFYPLSLLSQTSHLTLLVVAQFVVLWLVCSPTWNLYKKICLGMQIGEKESASVTF